MPKGRTLSLTPLQREEVAEYVLNLAKRFPQSAAKFRKHLELPDQPAHLMHQAIYLENAAAFAKFVAYRIRTARLTKYPDPTASV